MGDFKPFAFRYVDAAEVMALSIALPIACFAVVILRFYTRSSQKMGIGIDDWLSVLGLFSVAGCGGGLVYGALKSALGHPTPPTPSDLPVAEKALYTNPTTILIEKARLGFPFEIFQTLAYGCIKTGIVFFYRRIFVTRKASVFDFATKFTVIVLILWTLTFILLVIFPCGLHIWANWASLATQAIYCPIGLSSEYGLAISDLILDIVVVLMPLPLIWKLHLRTGRKIAIIGILLLGLSAVGASIARLVLYVQNLHAIAAKRAYDLNQSITVSFYWSLLEAGLALIASCLPALSHLLRHRKFDMRSTLRSVRSKFSLRSMPGSTAHLQHSDNRDLELAPLERPVFRDDVGLNG